MTNQDSIWTDGSAGPHFVWQPREPLIGAVKVGTLKYNPAVNIGPSQSVLKKTRSGLPELNVVLLGETQSGKSTLIETIRRYADPDCLIQHDSIGDGVTSHTAEVRTSTITTGLPRYHVEETTQGPDGTPATKTVEHEAFMDLMPEQKHYEKAINERKGLKLKQGISASPRVFHLFDTPGLNDTNGQDEMHVTKVFDAIASAKDIHLIIITTGQGPFTPGLQKAIRCYVDMFPEFLDNMALVHTRTNYAHLHPKDPTFSTNMAVKRNVLHQLMGRSNFTHFTIDCDFECRRPIKNCITNNTIHDILKLADFNQPIRMTKLTLVKTPRMKEADALIKDKYDEMINALEMTLTFKNIEEGELLAQVSGLEAQISRAKLDISSTLYKLEVMDVDDLDILHEDRFDQFWGLLNLTKEEHTMELKEQPYNIDEIKAMTHNVDVQHSDGGMGHRHWKVQFKTRRMRAGIYHVRLLTMRKNKNQESIAALRAKRERLQAALVEYEALRVVLLQKCKDKQDEIRENADNHNWCLHIVKRATEQHLQADNFQALVQTKAYLGSPIENAAKVAAVYLELTRRTKNAEYLPYFLSSPQQYGDFELPELENRRRSRNIVLVGKPGAGSATVANMLLQGDIFGDNRISRAQHRLATTAQTLDGRGWCVLDTFGLGLVEGCGLSMEEKAKGWIESIVTIGVTAFDHIVYVVNKNDLVKQDHSSLYALFRAVFKGAESNMLLLVTHCEDPSWIKDNRQMITSIFGNVMAINCHFMFDESDPYIHRDARMKVLKEMETKLRVVCRAPTVMHLSMGKNIDWKKEGKLSALLRRFLQKTEDAGTDDQTLGLGEDTATNFSDDDFDNEGTVLDDEESFLLSEKTGALEALTSTQKRIDTILSQRLDIHEHTQPRLFIVLPEDADLPLAGTKFRLFFLCECGTTTGDGLASTRPTSRAPQHVHFAYHLGYLILRPNKFFHVYGAYTLTLLLMLKYRLLAELSEDDSEGTEPRDEWSMFPASMGIHGKDAGSLLLQAVNRMVDYLEERADIQPGTGHELSQKSLWHMPQSLLGGQQEGEESTLGNLYRTATPQGYIKWVCHDHFRELYRTFLFSEQHQVPGVISHDQRRGIMSVFLTSKPTAIRLYEALAKTRTVLELTITLAWDVLKADLQMLREALHKTSVSVLTVDCQFFKSPQGFEFVNRSSRFNPLREMMELDGNFSSISIVNCPRFFERIGMSELSGGTTKAFAGGGGRSAGSESYLQDLKLDCVWSSKTVCWILNRLPLVTTLTLTYSDGSSNHGSSNHGSNGHSTSSTAAPVFPSFSAPASSWERLLQQISEIVAEAKTLTSLTLCRGQETIKCILNDGRIETLEMELERLPKGTYFFQALGTVSRLTLLGETTTGAGVGPGDIPARLWIRNLKLRKVWTPSGPVKRPMHLSGMDF